MSIKTLSEKEFHDQIVCNYTDVIGEKLGGSIESFSDEWFAELSNLIKPKLPIRDATKFVFAGAWYDGWETRRHNTEPFDYVIIKMGVSSAKIKGVEVDTAFFNGNHAPFISVELSEDLQNWDEVIPKLECGPSQKHFFVRDEITDKNYQYVKLKQYPDGGIARFRCYGTVVPILPQDLSTQLDLASVLNGGVAVSYSDQHFGSADNLILPGRGFDMSDGWETKRSRTPNHVDWVIIKLGYRAKINKIVIDTAHFRGNFPQYIELHGCSSSDQIPVEQTKWDSLVAKSKTGADKEHEYDVETDKVYTHVKLTIIPDGGVKRVRVFGNIVV